MKKNSLMNECNIERKFILTVSCNTMNLLTETCSNSKRKDVEMVEDALLSQRLRTFLHMGVIMSFSLDQMLLNKAKIFSFEEIQ